jgi:hypothetical protein
MAADMCPPYTGAAGCTTANSSSRGGVGLAGCAEALVASVSYDRTVKVWAPEEGAGQDQDSDEDEDEDEGDDDDAEMDEE